MSLSILNNIPSLAAENQINITNAELQKTLQQLSSGKRINSGADDAAGLAIADGLNANVAALTQSSQNATDGVGALQVADGALSQVSALLNRAVTLATEASSSTVSTGQDAAVDAEYQAILTEIGNINTATNFNGQAVFGSLLSVFTSDGTAGGTNTISVTPAAIDTGTLKLSGTDLTSSAKAQAALTAITAAITTISGERGTLGATVEQLQASAGNLTTETQNLTAASSNIMSADIGQTVSHMTQYNILQQTGMAALSQSNQAQQAVLKLLQ